MGRDVAETGGVDTGATAWSGGPGGVAGVGEPVDSGTVVAIILAGGAGRRIGGVDKAALALGDTTFLERVLAAAGAVAGRLVVVGPPRPLRTERAVIFVQEADPGGGPVPAVAAGLDATGGGSVVLLLAVDLPMVTASDLGRLLSALASGPGSVAAAALDHRGRPNPLLAAYRVGSLRTAIDGIAQSWGAPASLLLPANVAAVDLGEQATLNVNTPADLARAQATVRGGNQS